jgi:hypothetical protein
MTTTTTSLYLSGIGCDGELVAKVLVFFNRPSRPVRSSCSAVVVVAPVL